MANEETDRRISRELANELRTKVDSMVTDSDKRPLKLGFIEADETRGNVHVHVVQGDFWLASDVDDGLFFSTISNEEYERSLEQGGTPDGDVERVEINLPYGIPEKWQSKKNRVRLTWEVTLLEEDGVPIEPQVDFPQEPPQP